MNYIYLAIAAVAFVFLECYTGGTRLLYSLPAYTLLGVASVLTVFSFRSSRISPRPACLLSSGLFFGYILVRSWCSPVEYIARQDFFMVLASLVIYLFTAFYLVKPGLRAGLAGVLMAVAIGQVAIGLVQFSRGDDFMLFGYQRFPNGHRASGQYISPNHLAGYLEVIAIMGMSLVIWSKWKTWAKVLAAYVSLVAFAGIMMTGSRGGYLSTGFCVLTFCILSAVVVKLAFPEKFLRVTLVGLVLLLAVSAAIPVVVTSHLVRSRANSIFVKDMRLQLWTAAGEQIKINPAFGTGSATYLFYGRKFRHPEVQNDPVRVHNDYLELLTDYGAVGAAGFLIFLGAHLMNGFRTLRWLIAKRLQFSADWRSDSLALNLGALCAMAAYMVHSVVDFNLHIPVNSLLMAFVFGILANPGLETFQPTKTGTIINRLFQCSLPVIGLALLAFGTPKLPGEYYTEQARVALRDGRYTEAMNAAKKAVEWEKGNPDLYFYQGEARRKIADGFPPSPIKTSFYKAASDAFQQGLQLFPEDSRLLLIEGWTQDALGNHDQAGDYFRRALEWDPNSTQAKASYQGHLDYLKVIGHTPETKQ